VPYLLDIMVELKRTQRRESALTRRWRRAFGLYHGDRDRDRRSGLNMPVACLPQPWIVAGPAISSFRAKPHFRPGLRGVSRVERHHRDHAAGRGPDARICWAVAGGSSRCRSHLVDCSCLEDRGRCHRELSASFRGNILGRSRCLDWRSELGRLFLGLAVPWPHTYFR